MKVIVTQSVVFEQTREYEVEVPDHFNLNNLTTENYDFIRGALTMLDEIVVEEEVINSEILDVTKA